MADLNLVDFALRYGIIPAAGVIAYLLRNQQSHEVEIAILRSQLEGTKEMHTRELEAIRLDNRESFSKISAKLDSLEAFLRHQ